MAYPDTGSQWARQLVENSVAIWCSWVWTNLSLNYTQVKYNLLSAVCSFIIIPESLSRVTPSWVSMSLSSHQVLALCCAGFPWVRKQVIHAQPWPSVCAGPQNSWWLWPTTPWSVLTQVSDLCCPNNELCYLPPRRQVKSALRPRSSDLSVPFSLVSVSHRWCFPEKEKGKKKPTM